MPWAEAAFAYRSVGMHNYCRNPGGVRDRAWCFTTLDRIVASWDWQYCDIGLKRQQYNTVVNFNLTNPLDIPLNVEWRLVSHESTAPLTAWNPVELGAKTTFEIEYSRNITWFLLNGLNVTVRWADASQHHQSTSVLATNLHRVRTLVRDITIEEAERLQSQPFAAKDIDYTSSVSSLAAAWPSSDIRDQFPDLPQEALSFLWSISTQAAYLGCSGAIACSTIVTRAEIMIARNLRLKEGNTYYVCFKLQFGHTACSNGVMVDRSPPSGGLVRAGLPLPGYPYSASTSALSVRWTDFVDAGGVAGFDLGIGLGHSQKNDVLAFSASSNYQTADGLAYIEGLELQHGFTYFVEVKATDYTGLVHIVTSNPVTIDITPPVAGSVFVGSLIRHHAHLMGARGKLTCTVSGWYDTESGIESYTWGIGATTHYPDLWQEDVEGDLVGVQQLTASLHLEEHQRYHCVIV